MISEVWACLEIWEFWARYCSRRQVDFPKVSELWVDVPHFQAWRRESMVQVVEGSSTVLTDDLLDGTTIGTSASGTGWLRFLMKG